MGFFRPLRARLRLVPAAPAPASTAALVRQRTDELASYLRRAPDDGPAHDVHHAQDCLSASGLLAARVRGRRFGWRAPSITSRPSPIPIWRAARNVRCARPICASP